MKQYKTFFDLSLCVFTLLSPTHVAAQACSPPAPLSINATGSQTLINPFKTPTGPFSNSSGKWTWNIATESYPATAPNISIRQALWLDTQPPQDLLSSDLRYLGCSLIAHGLKQNLLQKGQNDNGTCESVFSQKCIAALIDGTAEYATLLAPSKGMQIKDICAEFGTQNRHGVPPDCYDAFEDYAWVEAFHALCPNPS